jgi:hypothetical protein
MAVRDQFAWRRASRFASDKIYRERVDRPCLQDGRANVTTDQILKLDPHDLHA